MSPNKEKCLIFKFFKIGGFAEKIFLGGKEQEEVVSFLKMYFLLKPKCKECLFKLMAKQAIAKSEEIEIPDCNIEQKIKIKFSSKDCLITKIISNNEGLLQKLENEEITADEFNKTIDSQLSPFLECQICFSLINDSLSRNVNPDLKNMECLHMYRTKQN